MPPMSTVRPKSNNTKSSRTNKKKNTTRKVKQRKTRGSRAAPPRGFRSKMTPGQRIQETGLLTSRNAPMKNRAMVLEEDEYISDVYGSVNFATTGFAVNPGQSAVFPWGSKISQLFEEYDFQSLEFYVTSEVSGYATQGQTGVVILSFDYDAADPAPTTKQQVEATNPHTIPCLPSTSVINLSVDCANTRSTDAKYVRPGALPANTDIKTYDIGNLYVSTQGQANNSAFGELHVRYRCQLKKQILEPPSAPSLNGGSSAHWYCPYAGTGALVGNTLQAGSTLPGAASITWDPLNMFVPANAMLAGNYLLVVQMTSATSNSGIGINSILGDFAPGPNLFSVYNAVDTNHILYSGAATGTNGSVLMVVLTYTPSSAGGQIIFASPTSVGSAYSDTFLIALPDTLLTAIVPPTSSSSSDSKLMKELLEMRKEMAALRTAVRNSCDSDFEEEYGPSSTPPRPSLKKSDEMTLRPSSPGIDSLSRSTVDLIGELARRKAAALIK